MGHLTGIKVALRDLRANYLDFFWKTVRPYIGNALR